jgi:hypothetical protein
MGKGIKRARPLQRASSPSIEQLEPLERRLLLAQPTGALTGKIVYTVGGHGITANYPGNGQWATQRGDNNDLVEDFGNQDQMTAYVNYLFNAGATVVPLRPVGHQTNEVVVDTAQATFSGAWSNGVSTPYFGNAGDAIKYRSADSSSTQTAVAKFTPNIPKGGIYPVYAWALDGANRLPDQIYRVTYTGGSSEVKVNHQRVGKGWVYLGSYYFAKGTSGFVEVSNKSSTAGVAIADAIRFGNGMGDISRGAGVSGYAREDEPALYWIMKMAGVGTPQSAYYGTNTNDRDATVSAAPRYAAYMNNEAAGTNTDRIFLSFHTNAGSGANRGTLGLVNGNNDPATATPHMQEWATLVAREVNDDLVKLGTKLEHPWFDRGSVVTLDRTDIEFGEINNLRINDEFDATIIEVGFHDNVQDSQDLLDPKVRDWVGRASYQATVKYFNTFAAGSSALLPEPATNVRAIADAAGAVTVSWGAPAADTAGGQAATGFVVYTSTNGLGFDGGRVVAGGSARSLKITGLSTSQVYYFKVVATNAGGASKSSEVVVSRPRIGGVRQVLIVNGFDRLDRLEDQAESGKLNTASSVIDTWFRARDRFNNTRDYVSLVGEAVEAFGVIAVDTAQNESITGGQVRLSDYKYVIWLDGEEGVKDETFNAAERTAISNYLAANGKLFVSGSEIGFDLAGNNRAKSFFNNTLRAGYVADDAGSYTASGAGGSIFEGLNIAIDNGTAGTYDVDAPDKLAASAGSKIALNYTGTGSGAAAVQYSNATGQRVVTMGFPFESITNGGVRNAVMKAVLNFFGAGPTAPGGLTLAGGTNIKLDWNNNPETNIKGYNIYRSRTRAGPYEKINGSLVTSSAYTDTTIPAGKTFYYRVTAVTTSNFEGLFSAVVSGRKSTLMIDAGGSGYTDSKGNVWGPDRGFNAGTATTSGFAVGNTLDDPLYQSRRFGTFGYSIDVPNGDYVLKLYFADPSFTTSGKRKFDVLVEGATVLNDFDLAANGGGRAAIVKTFNVHIEDGKLSLFFEGVVDNAIVSAIELI